MKISWFKFSTLSLLALILLVGQSCGDAEQQVKNDNVITRPLGSELDLFWNLIENGIKDSLAGSSYKAEFILQNNSNQTLDSTGWAIYFNQPRNVISNQTSKNVKITHINGDYFRLEPTPKFKKLAPGDDVIMTFNSEAWVIKDVDAPNGIYIVFTDTAGVETKPELLTNISYGPLKSKKQTSRYDHDSVLVPTPDVRFKWNSELSFSAKDSLVKIIPTPVKYEEKQGTFELKSGLKVAYAKGLKNEADFLVKKLNKDLGIAASAVEGAEGTVVLKISDVKVDGKDAEAYALNISADGVEVNGSDSAAVFYGIQSLRALVSHKDLASKSGAAKVPFVAVEDAPRFGYRGMHLDVSRNFSKKETVLNLIDVMSYYKLNKFHFHIVDDEGWRLEIPGLPELTEVGGRRGHTKDESDMLNPAYGSGPHPDPSTSFGSGYYTKNDFIEILKYAAERHIEVIPELDFPGHARAAIVAMKARQKRLIAEGEKAKANEYILHDPNDASRYRSIQLYDDNVICVCQPSTYRFLEKLTDEVINMYDAAGLKLKQVHIGGDEVPHPTTDDPGHGAWKGSPKCNAFLEADDDYKNSEELFYYFVDRFSKILEDRDIVTAGWEEISLVKGEDEDGEPFVEQNEEFKERGFVPYVWNTVWGWGGEDRAYKLANAGFKVVLSNVTNNYFDLAYDKDPSDPGYYWGGFVDTKKAWQFVPLNVYAEELTKINGEPVDLANYENAVRLTEDGKQNILGIQGQLWAETVKGRGMLEHYIFPKMLGMVERSWAKDPYWTSIKTDSVRFAEQDKDWNQFASRIGYFELPRLTYMNGGLNYRIAAPGAKIIDGKLVVNNNYPGFTVRYTTDGSEPTDQSPVYSEPIAVTGKVLKVASFNAKGRSSSITELELTGLVKDGQK